MFRQIHELFESVMSVPVQGKIAVDFADFAQHPDFEHLESYLDRIDIAFFGLGTRDQSLIASLAALAERWHKLFVVTLGADGSLAYFGHDRFSQAAIAVDKVVDTTGAGDAFAAAFLASHMHGADLPTSLLRGAQLAATVVQQLGAFPD
jgi:sugar/nucleoside kinase (ribokinase family)